MREASGVITLVQESRFRMADDAGRTRLFILSHSAAVEPQDLVPLMLGKGRVLVRFENLAGQIAAVAKEIVELGRPEAGAPGSLER